MLVERLASIENGQVKPLSDKAWLYVYGDVTVLHAGDSLAVPGGWDAIVNRGNPFELNNAALQRRRGIRLQQFASATDIKVWGKAGEQGQSWLGKVHGWCDGQLKKHMKDTATLGLLQAMILGDESGFDPELRQAYSQTGVIHIVSISGSHVGMLYLCVTGILFWMKGRKGKWAKFIAGIVLVWIYVLMAGGPPSAMRSAVMFTVLAVCALADRDKNHFNTITGAAFGLLIYQPAWLFSVGFQLSFAAILSILIFYRPFFRLWYWPQQWLLSKRAWQAITASFAAEILTAPIVVYYFHNFPLHFIMANLLAGVLIGICALVGGMAIIAFSWLPAVANALGWTVTVLVGAFNTAIIWMQGLNAEGLQHLQINGFELVLLYLAIAFIGIAWLKQKTSALSYALLAGCLVMAFLNYDHYRALRQTRLVVYNNGRNPSVEMIHGNRFETLAGEANNYSTSAAHNGYGAWRQGKDYSVPYLTVAGKTVLVLSDSAQDANYAALPADVLVLARPLWYLPVGQMLRAFHPKEVVLAVRPNSYQLQRWSDSCAARNIRLFNVAARGAYIVE
jgi:competence protein ComEC